MKSLQSRWALCWAALCALTLICCGASTSRGGDQGSGKLVWPPLLAEPDLMAVSIEFKLLQQYDDKGTKGRVRIRGIVTNCQGGVSYGTNHAALYLNVGSHWEPVANSPIPPLSTGAVSHVVYECDWDKDAPAGTAFKLSVEKHGASPEDKPFNDVVVRSSAGLSALLHYKVNTPKGSSPGDRIPKPNWPQLPTPWERFRRAR